MLENLRDKLDTIEILRLLISEYKAAHTKCLCPLTRQKIAWDWHKAVMIYKLRQREALDLADELVTDLKAVLA